MRSFALAAALFFCAARAAGAQLPPNDDWRTLRTQHFRVHFTPAVEEDARRAAVNAERAYAELSTELVPPRGTIDLVISDNVDYVNGYATPFPSNRIVVFAHPPTDASGLRNYDDWNALVVTHELTHIFHLDRSLGIWRFGQAIFGRNPLLFPNLYEPRWVIEGLAVYFESRMTGVGRLESSEHSMTARAAALDNRLPTLQELSPGTSRFPGGNVVYIYGSLLFDYLSRTRGPGSIREFVERGAKTPFPFILTLTSRSAFGMSFQTAWEHWRDSLVREMRSPHEVMPGWRQLTNGGRVALFPRWLGDTTLVYAGDKAREMPSAYEVTLSGRETRLGRRNGTSPNVRMPDGGILFSQPDFLDPYHIRNDLYVERNGSQTRLTTGARLTSPDARVDGEIVAVQDEPATTRLVRLSSDGRTLVPLTPTSIDVQWADPRWSPDGSRIAAVKQSRGRSEIAIIGLDGKMIDSFGATHAINSSPSWSPDGTRIYFSSERSGSPQIYVADVTTFAPTVARISDASTGVFAPEASPDQSQLATLLFKADGYHLGVAPFSSLAPVAADSTRTSPRSGCANCVADVPGLAPLGASDTSRATKYSPWVSLLPRYWSPVVESTTDDGTSWGAYTSGSDIVDRHDYVVEVLHNSRWAEKLRLALVSLRGIRPAADRSLRVAELLEWDIRCRRRGRRRQRAVRTRRSARELSRSRRRSFVRVSGATRSRSIGGELEGDSYSTRPDTVLQHLSSFFSADTQLSGADCVGGLVERAAPGREHLARGWNQHQRERTSALAGRHDRRRHSQRRRYDVGLQVARPPGFCAPRARASRRGRHHR